MPENEQVDESKTEDVDDKNPPVTKEFTERIKKMMKEPFHRKVLKRLERAP